TPRRRPRRAASRPAGAPAPVEEQPAAAPAAQATPAGEVTSQPTAASPGADGSGRGSAAQPAEPGGSVEAVAAEPRREGGRKAASGKGADRDKSEQGKPEQNKSEQNRTEQGRAVEQKGSGESGRGGGRRSSGRRQGRGREQAPPPPVVAAQDRLGTPPKAPKNGLRVFALGGIGEIGRNMTVFEYGGKLLIVDCGVLFPEDQQPGVDLILPDFRPIEDRMDDIVAIVLTRGHEDHIGAVPFLLRNRSDIPVLGAKFTLALVAAK